MHKKINSFIEKQVGRMPLLVSKRTRDGVQIVDSLPTNHGRRIRKQLENILAKSPQLVTRQQHLFAAFVVIKAYEFQVIQPAMKSMEERKQNQERIKELEEAAIDIKGVDDSTRGLLAILAEGDSGIGVEPTVENLIKGVDKSTEAARESRIMLKARRKGNSNKIERMITEELGLVKSLTIEDIKHHGRQEQEKGSKSRKGTTTGI